VNFVNLIRDLFNKNSKTPVARGHAIDELAVIPLGETMNQFYSELVAIEKIIYSDNWENLNDSDLDTVAARSGISRVRGSIASGYVRIKTDNPQDFIISTKTVFSTGYKQFVAYPSSYPKSVFIRDGEGYYVDIYIAAVSSGSDYTLVKGDSLSISNIILKFKSAEVMEDFINGAEYEDNASLLNRIKTSNSDRNIVTHRGINSVIKERFPFVLSHYITRTDRDLVHVNQNDDKVFLGKFQNTLMVKSLAYFDFFPATAGTNRFLEYSNVSTTEAIPNSVAARSYQSSDDADHGFTMSSEYTDEMYRGLYFLDGSVKATLTTSDITGGKKDGVKITFKLTGEEGSLKFAKGSKGGIGVSYFVHNGMIVFNIDHDMDLGNMSLMQTSPGVSTTRFNALRTGLVDIAEYFVDLTCEDGQISVVLTDMEGAKSLSLNTYSDSVIVKKIIDESDGSDVAYSGGVSDVIINDTTKTRPLHLFKIKVDNPSRSHDIDINIDSESYYNGEVNYDSEVFVWKPSGGSLSLGEWKTIEAKSTIEQPDNYTVLESSGHYIYIMCTTKGTKFTGQAGDATVVHARCDVGYVSVKSIDTGAFSSLTKVDMFVHTKSSALTPAITSVVLQRGVDGLFVLKPEGDPVSAILSVGGGESFYASEMTGVLDEEIVIDTPNYYEDTVEVRYESYPGIRRMQQMFNGIVEGGVFGDILVRHKAPHDVEVNIVYAGGNGDVVAGIKNYFDSSVTTKFSPYLMIMWLQSNGYISSGVSIDNSSIDITPKEYFNIVKISAVKQ